MAISDKLTYLNTTKGKIKDSINLTGAGITDNDTFRSYAVKLKDGLVNVLNNGTIVLYNNFPKVSGIGSNISLSNTLEAPMFMNKFDGDTLQDGTPTPSNPVDIQSVEGIQNINVCGKNLWSTTIVGATDPGETPVVGTGYNRSKNYVSVQPNTTYIFSSKNNNVSFQGNLIFANKNKTNISQLYEFSTFTTPAGCYYIRIIGTTEKIPIGSEIQLEKGNQATTYEAYTGNTYEVNLGTIKLYNGDYITGTPDNWSIVRNNGRVVLNGSEDWTYYQNNIFYTYIYNYPEILKSSAINCISDSYKCLISTSTASEFENLSANYDYTMNLHTTIELIRIKDTRFTTSQQLKTALTNNNVEVVYKLATPTTEQITDEYLISQLNALYNAKSYNGQTNISVSGNLPMILEVSALKDEI